jgi:hypothetical protein
MKQFKDLLIELNACEDAIDWVGNKTIEQALADSQRGDWLLWLAKKLDLPLNKLTLAKARCAKTVIHLMKDQRNIDAVNVAEKFGLDECTIEELNTAAYYAYAAYAADAAAYYAYAAYAADADADELADFAAYAAAYAADAAAYAADAAADAAKIKNRKQTSDICIEILGELIIDAVNKKLTSL